MVSEEYSLKFNEGEPIDATNLQKIVTYLNELNSKVLKIPSGSDIAGDVVSAVMTMGSSAVGNISTEGGKATRVPISFAKKLTNTPFGVVVTLESSDVYLDVTYYVTNVTKDGFDLMVNPIVGLTATNQAFVGDKASKTFTGIKVHYFAIAQPTI